MFADLFAASTGPRGFFLVAGLGSPSLQFRHHLIERHAAGLQHDEQMVEHVGALSDELGCLARNCGDHGFDRLLAEFSGGALRSAVEERFCIGGIRRRFGDVNSRRAP